MAGWMNKRKLRRKQVREKRAKLTGTRRAQSLSRLFSWPVLSSVAFIALAVVLACVGEMTLGYSTGQHIKHPVYARVPFQVPDAQQTAADREAARARTPSYYTPNAGALTFDRIRADLMRLYQAVADAESFEQFSEAAAETGWPADERAYQRLRAMAHEAGRDQFQQAVDALPLEQEYVARDLLMEPREPKSVSGFIRLEETDATGAAMYADVRHGELVPFGNERALKGAARDVARKLRMPELVATVEAIVRAVFSEQPTIVFSRERTLAEMRRAEELTPQAMKGFEVGKVFVNPGLIGMTEYGLLRAEHDAYLAYLKKDDLGAAAERHIHLLRQVGLGVLVAFLSIGLLAYVRLYHPRIFEVRMRTIAFMALLLGTLLAGRLLHLRWPDWPELIYGPCLIATFVLAIAYPRRLAGGTMCITGLILATTIDAGLTFLLPLFAGIAVAGHYMAEVRSRTKLPAAGLLTGLAVLIVAEAAYFMERQGFQFALQHAVWGGICALGAGLVVSGMLPFIERMFRVATSLTLLEWRDPTRPLLQLLAREAPGTYNHSLMVGTLGASACDTIGANGLLVQVGALYHDIGKITKPAYFTENQEGRISRHENLAPTMSLLIILGHVKDGVEMAKEYKLPRVLYQFIAEHHGTTVVRYFHHMASEKQPQIASGRHDRAVPEAEFRYSGPKPRTRESAVLMLADGVEGAVRALAEPTPGRIESVVHQVVMDRLNDGQFDDCDITLKELRCVEEALVKSLCGIYHARVPYPKAKKDGEEATSESQRERPAEQRRVSV